MSADFDVFLSYQWDIKPKIRSLYRLLTEVYNLKVWMDDHELDHTGNLYDQLVNGLKCSKYFLCFVTQKYAQSKNCKFEIEFASNLNSKMIVIMIEDLQMKDIGSVGLIINVKTRINMFQQAKLDNIWSGEAYDSLLKSIQISNKEIVPAVPKRKLFISCPVHRSKKKALFGIISIFFILIFITNFVVLTLSYQNVKNLEYEECNFTNKSLSNFQTLSADDCKSKCPTIIKCTNTSNEANECWQHLSDTKLACIVKGTSKKIGIPKETTTQTTIQTIKTRQKTHNKWIINKQDYKYLAKVNDTHWGEFQNGIQKFTFEERNSTENEVILFDESRESTFYKLNLKEMFWGYSFDKINLFIYSGGWDDNKWIINKQDHKYLAKVNDTHWGEFQNGIQNFTFEERNSTDNEVILFDESRESTFYKLNSKAMFWGSSIDKINIFIYLGGWDNAE